LRGADLSQIQWQRHDARTIGFNQVVTIMVIGSAMVTKACWI